MRLPEEFQNNMRDILRSSADDFFLALDSPEVKALTVDTNKISLSQFEAEIRLEVSRIEGSPNGYYYTGKIGDELLHHAGVIYSQDASAQIPVMALGVERGDKVLDVCAAPGGKSVQILQRLAGSGLLVSNEYVYNRAKILYENIVRFGYNNYIVTSNLPNVFDNKIQAFDKILVDAPCSGEGMFRKKDIETYDWNIANVAACAARQYEILQSVKHSLNVGGKLVYSTCTYNIEENEKVVARFLAANPDYQLIPLPEDVATMTSAGIDVEGYPTRLCGRRYPHIHRGEGQFVALLQRVGGIRLDEVDDDYAVVSRKEAAMIDRYLIPILDTSSFCYYKKGDNVYIPPNEYIDISGLNVTSLGVYVGTMTSNGIDLSHSFYKAYGNKFYSVIDLDQTRAMTYLSGNVVDIPEEYTGISAVTYNGIVLGGGKSVRGVLKNYYPKALRR